MKKVVALIPCRKNSKGIPNKNMINFSGKPLIYWTLKSLKDSKIIDDVYVTSDSDRILNYSKKFKSYLEIGCQSDVNFSKIKIENKVGVDPHITILHWKV